MDEMRTLNMGGTAVGTGLNADESYLRRIVPNLSEISGMDLVQAYDLIDATQNLDSFVAVSGAVKACAVTLSKICKRSSSYVFGTESQVLERLIFRQSRMVLPLCQVR